MRNWLAVGLIVGVVGSIGGGCSSSSGAATPAAYCVQLAQAECPPVVNLCEDTESACEADVEARCTATASAAQAGNVRSFDADNVAACLSAISSAFGSLNPTRLNILAWTTLNGNASTAAPAAGSPNDICAQVFVGTVPLNGTCTSNYDCGGGNICGSNGTCGPENDRQAGDTCGDSGDLCPAGTVCAQSGKLFVCGAGGAPGATCSETEPCSTTAQCKGGKCVALGGEGDPCTTNADCIPGEAGLCDTSLSPPSCARSYAFGPRETDCKAFGGN